jgi:hypothetical protein
VNVCLSSAILGKINAGKDCILLLLKPHWLHGQMNDTFRRGEKRERHMKDLKKVNYRILNDVNQEDFVERM